MPILQVDVAYDCDHNIITKDYAKTHCLSVKLLKEIGPAGGNPLYEFTGTRNDLVTFIKDFYENIDVDYHVARIKG